MNKIRELFIPFAYNDFVFLWIASIAYQSTMQLRILVTTVWLYEITGSAVQLGLIGGVQLIMQIPSILYGGSLADKIDRKKLIEYSQATVTIIIFVLTLLIYADQLKASHIYLATALLSVVSVIGQPARAALVATVVKKEHLPNAVALHTATMQIATAIAPLFFAILVYFFGIKEAFLATLVCALFSAILPIFIKKTGLAENIKKSTSVMQEILEGWRFVKKHPILPSLYLMDIGVTVVSFYRQILPVLADKLYKQGATAVGLLSSASSAGGIIGSVMVISLSKYKPKGMLVLYATGFYAILLMLFGISTSLWVGCFIIFFLGATDSIGMTTRQTIVQLTTPDNMRGRAVSFHSLSAMTANNIGTLEVGFFSALIGADNTMVIGGIIALMVVVLIYSFSEQLRSYRYP
ncbi:MAG: MFS transporter [Dehalococcoidia bacterium]|jgi:MFS family permease|nr:MAG: putative arabinose efflux permease, MFS family [Chloroflexota bacterium]|tara:strand:- start:2755 stop:3978 length:1224 start_codon:yes stop_codon:yes gene_type:complete